MTLRRRDFVRGLSTLALVNAAPIAAMAAATPTWTRGFQGVDSDQPPISMQIEGEIPKACLGSLYRNGPALYSRGSQRYEHWFDPDGMVQEFRIGAKGIKHRGRFVRTQRFVQEEDAGSFLYGGAGTHFSTERPVRNNETTNVANINVQPLNGELIALWEAGAPYRIDPETLETSGQYQWSPELRGVPFSAHPRFDERGHLWNIGSVPFVGAPSLVLYHIGSNGVLVKTRLHRLDFPGYMHDFILTPRYLLALNSSAVFGDGETFVDRMHWQGNRPSQLLVFNRNDFSLLQSIEIPPTFVFHFSNAWEQQDHILFTACAHPDSRFVTTGMRLLAGQRGGDFHHSPELVLYDVDLTRGSVALSSLDTEFEFPSFDQRRPFSAQTVFGVTGQSKTNSPLGTSICGVNPVSGAVSRFDYGPDVIVEEPLFVKDTQSASGGYVIHTFLNHAAGHTGLSILDAQRIDAGPLAVATMERVMPLGFHGCFLQHHA